MKRNKDNQYGYSAWSMEEVMRFARFFLLPLLVVILIAVILMRKKTPTRRRFTSFLDGRRRLGRTGCKDSFSMMPDIRRATEILSATRLRERLTEPIWCVSATI